ncbi:MAG: 2-hydroxychromene-2-carboxylate isomerase [Rhodospirillaceae bacterium]|nr:2-hydroxychromene-2-carboxylate isomerase [Rhodospirillaceae bacterium]MBT4426388.1 2-hydroxychromene-2-carboxylate isomerase [Rhodospirillaceae bacterium]MBT5675430.1 2-hydroxychromene-2-carboxylate isomerase [Rhodospirillaceae bacterium]MBT6830470.1 2-hydroxychromene-2-carboxylate isomerase [Rhodospirillaceae bacterium]
MMQVVWYFDFISPFAYLQREALAGLPDEIEITYRPVLFAGLLNHWGHKGPAEIPAKRLHTYRLCCWLAERRGIPFTMPPAHPFNPLKALRLALALDARGEVIGEIFRFLYAAGGDLENVAEWNGLTVRLGLEPAAAEAKISDPEIKQLLKRNTDAALADGVFGVPTLIAEGELFWGVDTTEMFVDWLGDRESFAAGEFSHIMDLPVGARRNRT